MIENFNEKLLAFAKTKPADEEYFAAAPTACALAQFVKAELGAAVNLRSTSYVVGSWYYPYPIEAMWAGWVYQDHMAALNLKATALTWGDFVKRLEFRLSPEYITD